MVTEQCPRSPVADFKFINNSIPRHQSIEFESRREGTPSREHRGTELRPETLLATLYKVENKGTVGDLADVKF